MENTPTQGPGAFFADGQGRSYFSSTGKPLGGGNSGSSGPLEDVVTGTEVTAATDAGIDYAKLVEKFGCYNMTDELRAKIEALTGERPHRFIRRGIFFCHRDLDICLNNYEKMNPFYLYTGRGPSGESLHLGHTIPFIFT